MNGTRISATERHLQLPGTPPPAGARRPPLATTSEYGDVVVTSGQTAHRDGALVATGTVGDDVALETARRCAWQCARNVVASLAADGYDLDRVRAVRRVTVYVAATPAFRDHHLVADAASEYFHTVFGSAGIHTRAAIGVASLPTGSPVEVEAHFVVEG